MNKVLHILVLVLGAVFALTTIGWIFEPVSAAKRLEMDLLEGLGRNTQVGDFTAFFATITVSILLGALKKRVDFIYAAAMLLGFAATFRILAGLVHDAPMLMSAIGPEIICTIILLAYARTLKA